MLHATCPKPRVFCAALESVYSKFTCCDLGDYKAHGFPVKVLVYPEVFTPATAWQLAVKRLCLGDSLAFVYVKMMNRVRLSVLPVLLYPKHITLCFYLQLLYVSSRLIVTYCDWF